MHVRMHIRSHRITSRNSRSLHCMSSVSPVQQYNILHYITLHYIASPRIAWHGIPSRRIALHGMAWHRIASHHITSSPRIASRRVASRRIASHRIASHRIASHVYMQSQLMLRRKNGRMAKSMSACVLARSICYAQYPC